MNALSELVKKERDYLVEGLKNEKGTLNVLRGRVKNIEDNMLDMEKKIREFDQYLEEEKSIPATKLSF